MKKRLNGYYNYTVILTYLGMLAGFSGIAFVMEGKLRYAVLSLMIAGFCDMFDGAVAATRERNDSEKKFGIQIDSLSDLICFGVLPGLICYHACGRNYLAFAFGCFYTLCALIRLAYFNVMEEERQSQESGHRTSYQGLPVTTSAIFLPLVYIAHFRIPHGKIFLMAVVALMAIAFVSSFRVKKPQLVGKILMTLIGAAEFAMLLLQVGLKL